jgi:NADPH-dependent curcumin reductase CurA
VSERNRRFVLRERPSGRIGPGTFELVDEPVPNIVEGEALVRTQWISLDPANRGWIRDAPSYLPPVEIGEVMRGLGLGRVVASEHPAYREGQLVAGPLGWQEWAVTRDAALLQPVNEIAGVPASAHLGALGMTGLTAWVGMTDIGRPQPGETVVARPPERRPGSFPGELRQSGKPGRSCA